MPCYHPIDAWRREGEAKLSFSYRPGDRLNGDLKVPCGRCIGCRLERSKQWAIRCVHEATLHKKNSFITLTFSPEALELRKNQWSLNKTEFQKFMKRLRKKCGKVRFYHCGEYGEMCGNCQKSRYHCICGTRQIKILGRPHYHACLFGYDFPDKELYKQTDAGSRLYTSKILSELWPHGFSTIGDVTFESAAYVARYIMKKINGDLAENHYVQHQTGEILLPEYTTMSRRPGIGKDYLNKYFDDIYPHDHVIMNGKKLKPPRYYDKILKETRPFTFDDVIYERHLKSLKSLDDNTPDRLQVKEFVQQDKLKLLTRNKEI